GPDRGRRRGRSARPAGPPDDAPPRTGRGRKNCTARGGGGPQRCHQEGAAAILNYSARMDIAVQMFYYTLDGGRLAGLPGPAFMSWDFARLRKLGYTVVVSLECDRLNTFEIEEAGFEHKKICVEDFAPPTLDQVDEFV